MKVKESDWKQYRSLVPVVRDRYLAKKNEAFARMLENTRKNPTELFWDTREAIIEEGKLLNRIMGYEARSKMYVNLEGMCRIGMIEARDLEGFSQELVARMQPILDRFAESVET